MGKSKGIRFGVGQDYAPVIVDYVRPTHVQIGLDVRVGMDVALGGRLARFIAAIRRDAWGFVEIAASYPSAVSLLEIEGVLVRSNDLYVSGVLWETRVWGDWKGGKRLLCTLSTF